MSDAHAEALDTPHRRVGPGALSRVQRQHPEARRVGCSYARKTSAWSPGRGKLAVYAPEMAPGSDGRAFQRARTPEQKQQRRDAILTATRALSLRHGVRNVSLAAVANEAGLAKSNVLRYFQTRDDLYMNLGIEEWRDFALAAHARLATANSGPGEVADALAISFAERPLLCDIHGQPAAYLDSELSPRDLATAHRADAASEALLASINKALPQLGKPMVTDLVLVSAMIAGAIWIRANPDPGLRSLYSMDPEFEAAFLDFPATLQSLIRALINGLLANAEPPPRLLHQKRSAKASTTKH